MDTATTVEHMAAVGRCRAVLTAQQLPLVENKQPAIRVCLQVKCFPSDIKLQKMIVLGMEVPSRP